MAHYWCRINVAFSTKEWRACELTADSLNFEPGWRFTPGQIWTLRRANRRANR
jgi:hypothetical protein